MTGSKSACYLAEILTYWKKRGKTDGLEGEMQTALIGQNNLGTCFKLMMQRRSKTIQFCILWLKEGRGADIQDTVLTTPAESK